mgnify:FL=1
MDSETMKSVAIAVGKVLGVVTLWKLITVICKIVHK